MQMLTDHELQDIDRGLIVIRLIWIGLIIALGVYIVIANILGEGMISDSDETFVIVGYVLYTIGAMMLALVYFLRKSITNHKSLFSRLSGFVSMTDISTIIVSGGNPQSAIGRYVGGLLICFGWIEAVGIFGLVLFIVNGNFLDLYLLVGIAIVAQLYFRPRKQELIDLTTQLKQNKHIQQNQNVISQKYECPQCTQKVTAVNRFCPYCGYPLSSGN